MIVIEHVKLSKQTVTTGEAFLITVTVVHHAYLHTCKHSELKAYTNRDLRLRGYQE